MYIHISRTFFFRTLLSRYHELYHLHFWRLPLVTLQHLHFADSIFEIPRTPPLAFLAPPIFPATSSAFHELSHTTI